MAEKPEGNGITERTKAFAVRIIRACSFLDEKSGVASSLSKQLLRSGTAIGANIYEAQSAGSDKDTLHKLQLSLQEARETKYWIEILIESDTVKPDKFNPLLEEVKELIAILVIPIRKLEQKHF